MKLIFENWRRSLKENLSYFGKAFVEFKNRVDSGEDALSVANEILQPLGEGSTRIVFGFPDNQDIVLKVINTMNPEVNGEDKFGFNRRHKTVSNENEVDFQIHQEYPGLFPKGYERAPDYSWIVAERVDPIEHQELLELFGLPPLVNKRAYKKLAGYAVQHFKDEFGIQETSRTKTLKQPVRPAPNPYNRRNLLNILTTNPQSRKVFRAAAELKIPAREMSAKNLGTVKRNGKKEIVILDASLWEDR